MPQSAWAEIQDRLDLESALLERLMYKNQNQHRRGVYWRKLQEARRDVRRLREVEEESELGPMLWRTVCSCEKAVLHLRDMAARSYFMPFALSASAVISTIRALCIHALLPLRKETTVNEDWATCSVELDKRAQPAKSEKPEQSEQATNDSESANSESTESQDVSVIAKLPARRRRGFFDDDEPLPKRQKVTQATVRETETLTQQQQANTLPKKPQTKPQAKPPVKSKKKEKSKKKKKDKSRNSKKKKDLIGDIFGALL
ncbi:MAG: hypothetical protein MHM6MM_003258 [Cercozoa sp. M6MM]